MNIIKPIEIKNPNEIAMKFPNSANLLKEKWIFRGQTNDIELKTSLERACEDFDLQQYEEKIKLETSLIREFKRRFHHYNIIIPSPNDDLECLAVMQHYGAPTRLLDWTYSPYVALYFALADFSTKPVIWAINLRWLQESSFSLLKRHKKFRNLGNNEKKWIKSFIKRTPNAKEKKFAGNWLRSISPPINLIYPATPFYLNIRLTVQKGLFLCPGNIGISFVKNIKQLQGFSDGYRNNKTKNIIKFTFPNIKKTNKTKRLEFLRHLLSMNISADSLFPGLEGFARSMKVYHHIIDEIKSEIA